MSKPQNVEHATSVEVAVTADSDMGAIVAQVEAMKAGGVGIFSSLPSDTFEAKLATANALANALPIDEHLGEVIDLANFVVQAVEVTNTDAATGVSRKVPATRIVLVAADGSAYAEALLVTKARKFGQALSEETLSTKCLRRSMMPW